MKPIFRSCLLLVAACGGAAGDGANGGEQANTAPPPGASAPNGGTPGGPVDGCTMHTFGSHCFRYAGGTILPHGTQSELDKAAADFYDAWKAKYLLQACGAGRYYVQTNVDGNLGGGQAANSVTASEAHGYGMVIAAMMAGHDPDARAIFDGLYQFFRDHPSVHSTDLMAWNQATGCADAKDGNDSATDGDVDIAYALLLASKQWPSGGTIDYAAEAKKVIAAIGAHDVNATTNLTLLGDSSTSDDPMYFATRPSDMMLDHFRAYGALTGDARWKSVVDASYTLVATLQSTQTTGLVPDFVVKTNTTPAPAPPSFLEDVTDGDYAYNACRVPWHLGTDWVVSGDRRARTALAKMTTFIVQATGGDPSKIVDGYTLTGTKVGTDPEMAFVAPFAVAAMSDASNQAWLDATYAYVTKAKLGDSAYFGNTIKMLSLLVLTNNWWAPL
jgi:endo-1,4-beta-D-glucanase Y